MTQPATTQTTRCRYPLYVNGGWRDTSKQNWWTPIGELTDPPAPMPQHSRDFLALFYGIDVPDWRTPSDLARTPTEDDK